MDKFQADNNDYRVFIRKSKIRATKSVVERDMIMENKSNLIFLAKSKNFPEKGDSEDEDILVFLTLKY